MAQADSDTGGLTTQLGEPSSMPGPGGGARGGSGSGSRGAAPTAEQLIERARQVLPERYAVLATLGQGGMGTVFRGYDLKLRREVALKQLHASSVDEAMPARLVREAQAMARLNHENVVAVYDVLTGADDEIEAQGLCVVMEFVDGQDLRDWLEQSPQPDAILEAYRAAARGLAAAHQGGLVHRDFKPSNVLVGSDGRVKVTDFGLAKTEGGQDLEGVPALTAARPDSGNDSLISTYDGLLHDGLTRHDMVMGTPRYMAPEQVRGKEATAQSDQYAFCVALWESLCGKPPFRGRGRELYDLKMAGPPPWPSSVTVASRYVDAIRKGLAAHPEDRFDTMHDLVRALEPKRAPRALLGWLAAAGGVAALGAAVAVGALRDREPGQQCSGAPEQAAEMWSSRRADVRTAMLDTGLPFASDTFDRVDGLLARYAEDWSASRRSACEDTLVRGEFSDNIMDLRVRCLEQAATRAGNVVDALAVSDEDTVVDAVDRVTGLPSIADCSDIDRLLVAVPPPSDPELAARVDDLDRSLAVVDSQRSEGQFQRTAEQLASLEPQVEDTGYAPLQVQLRRIRAGSMSDRGEIGGALEQLKEAMVLASEAGDQRTFAEVSLSVSSYLADEARYDEAMWACEFALATARQVDPEGQLEARVYAARARIHRLAGRYAEAEADFLRSLDLPDEGPGARLSYARKSNGLAVVYRNQGRLREALERYNDAEASVREMKGDGHPDVATIVHNRGVVFQNLHRDEEAIADFQEAIDIQEPAFGRENPRLFWSYATLARSRFNLGRFDEAAAAIKVAEKHQRDTWGPEHPSTAFSIGLHGVIEVARGRPEEGRALAVEGATNFLARRPESSGAAMFVVSAGHADLELGDLDAAVDRFDQAIGLNQLAWRAPSLGELRARLGLSLALAARGERERALEEFEGAVRTRAEVARHGDLLVAAGGAAPIVSIAEFEGARAQIDVLTGTASQRAQGLADVKAVLEAATAPRERAYADSLRRWLLTQ